MQLKGYNQNYLSDKWWKEVMQKNKGIVVVQSFLTFWPDYWNTSRNKTWHPFFGLILFFSFFLVCSRIEIIPSHGYKMFLVWSSNYLVFCWLLCRLRHDQSDKDYTFQIQDQTRCCLDSSSKHGQYACLWCVWLLLLIVGSHFFQGLESTDWFHSWGSRY